MVNQNEEIYRIDCLIGYRISERIFVDESTSTEPLETPSKEIKTLPTHLINFPMDPQAKVEPGSS